MKQLKKAKLPFLAILLLISLIVNFFFIIKNFLRLDQKPNKTFTQTAVKIIDGDTFDTDQELRIRLALIDAPEYSKDCLSLESAQRLSALILGEEVVITELKKENFGRIIALVYQNGLLINKSQVEEGLAKFFNDPKLKNYSHDIELAQDTAIKAKRGIWSEKCQSIERKGCLIKGNYRSDRQTKFYHSSDCYNYDKITVNLKEKDQWFCTEEEARQAGFVKSQDCP